MSEMFSKVEVKTGVAVLASVYDGFHGTFIQRRLEVGTPSDTGGATDDRRSWSTR